jgi:Flp pilus assembly pilin Flp
MLDSLIAIVGTLVARARHQDGQTLAEYGILVAVIAVVVITAAIVLGLSTTALFQSDATHV